MPDWVYYLLAAAPGVLAAAGLELRGRRRVETALAQLPCPDHRHAGMPTEEDLEHLRAAIATVATLQGVADKVNGFEGQVAALRADVGAFATAVEGQLETIETVRKRVAARKSGEERREKQNGPVAPAPTFRAFDD